MSSITHYVGKVENKRIFLICENEKGQKVQVPHINFMTEQGLTAVAYHDATPKQPYKFLNTLELARFMTGRDIEGSILPTPQQQRIEHLKWMAKALKDPKFADAEEEYSSLVSLGLEIPTEKSTDWQKYIEYLLNWAKDHKDEVFEGCSPACYDEFCDNDLYEDDNE